MKFTISILITAALYGFTAAAPKPDVPPLRFRRDECVSGGGTWASCEYADLFLRCDAGDASLYACDGGCQNSWYDRGDGSRLGLEKRRRVRGNSRGFGERSLLTT
ncbi:uncharacterized protein F4807DRAFT_460731 [Annulohypoxylon truncatum]|uniref:uncharacterized protein n=1 Tax=Annulohypoxylon truncatum TaxID=327061 RepID=UPI00200831DF|nr:uncharacterized protein F4807DRAFT_460731 [Annulohypoxylon truncatum]KAI1209517.1 hypothetical protein F4807DRAFT_460731 [Annulohypoxylon truncatum]